MANLVQELISNGPSAEENVLKIKQELRKNGVTILPPNINESELDYKLLPGNKLLTGFKAIKFVGDDAIVDILNKRPFKSFLDFMDRIDSSKVRANTIQALVATGCLDSFGINRKNMFQHCSDYRKTLTAWKKKHNINQEDFKYNFDSEDNWSIDELYALEIKYMGEAFICKPYKAYKKFFNNQYMIISQIKKLDNKSKINSFKCIVKDFVELTIKKEDSKLFGQTMLKVNVEDSAQNTISLTIFPDRLKDLNQKLKKIKRIFEPGLAMHISATLNHYNEEISLIYDNIYELAFSPEEPKDIKEKKKNKKENLSLLEELEQDLFEQGKIDID
jgi:DNA polymerase-3 subunit alpha